MDRRQGNLVGMDTAELDRMERAVKLRLMTEAQRSARLKEMANMRRIKNEPKSVEPEVVAEGLAKAREALHSRRRP